MNKLENKDTEIAHVVLDVVRAANLLERLGGIYAKEAGLNSVQQYMILTMLSKEDSLSMYELRKSTLVTKQAITGLVERLNQSGYVEKYKDIDDQRVTRVSLTNKGKEALELIHPYRISGNRAAFAGLSGEEISQLSVILPKLIGHLENE